MKKKTKELLKLFIPEIILIIKRKFFEPPLSKDLKQKLSEDLFGGYNDLFKKSLSSRSIYGEYGCGKSTFYVLENFDIPILSVDSSEFWINKIKKKNKNINLHINYVNIGNVEDEEHGWGMPDDYSMRENFIDYANNIWTREQKPNVILIDGRLRVLCFLISLKYCSSGSKIIFDDYINRKHYHIVEELIKPCSNDGRQALFEVNDKNKIDMDKLEFLINKFNYILD